MTHLFLRNFIFGVEDSLVSTVGLVSGVAIANLPKSTILLTGVVLIFVEAFSMAVGSFLTEHSVESYLQQTESSMKHPFWGGVVMFFSYFLSGFIPLAPYLFMSVETALIYSILFSLVALFILGVISARLANTSVLRDGLKMTLVGGIAIGIGVGASIVIQKLV
jgi:VIT1/CCC1 family predicted Fe2+/Mn2+ transporter